MKQQGNKTNRTLYDHFWCVCTMYLPASSMLPEEDREVRDTIVGIASHMNARSIVMGHERRAMFTVTNTAARCSLPGREPGDDDRRIQIFLKQPCPVTEREFREMRKEIESDGGWMGQPFKGVIGCDPTDGMNYFRGTGNPKWLRTTAAILLEVGDGPVAKPQYVPASWAGEGYHAEHNEDGRIKTFQAYGYDLKEIAATIRRDFPELKEAELKEGTNADLAKVLLEMPDDDLITFLRRFPLCFGKLFQSDEVYKGDLPEVREKLEQEVKS